MNEDLSSCDRLREAVTGRGTLDMWHHYRIHGPEVFNTFASAWTKWEALDKRSYVLFGMADARGRDGSGKPPKIEDVESFYRMLRYSSADDSWTTWDNQPISTEKRGAEMKRWLFEEATPYQIDILKKYRAGEITFQPEDEPLARLLYHFLLLVKKLERLPSIEELKVEHFQLKAKKQILSGNEKTYFGRWLKLLGLNGLPHEYSGPYAWPPVAESLTPFDAFRESSKRA